MTDTVVRIDANEARARRVAELRANAGILIERVVIAAEQLAEALDAYGVDAPDTVAEEEFAELKRRRQYLLDSIALLGEMLDSEREARAKVQRIADAAWQVVALDLCNDAPFDEAFAELQRSVATYEPITINPILVALKRDEVRAFEEALDIAVNQITPKESPDV